MQINPYCAVYTPYFGWYLAKVTFLEKPREARKIIGV